MLPDGVISPGGIGFDINCGVRLLASDLSAADVTSRDGEARARARSQRFPPGTVATAALVLTDAELERVLGDGVPHLVRDRGLGDRGRPRTSRGGGMLVRGRSLVRVGAREGARTRPARNARRREPLPRGAARRAQCSTRAVARVLGLRVGQLTVLIHTGSRGLGHQVCTDYVAAHGRGAAALRHRAAGSPARVRSALVRAGARTTSPRWRPRRTSRGATARRSRTRCVRRSSGCSAMRSYASSTTSRTTSRRSRRHGGSPALRAPEGRDTRVRPLERRRASRVPERRSAGLHPGQHGNGLLRARRHRRRARDLVGQRVSRSGPRDEPSGRQARGGRATRSARSSTRAASSSSVRRTRSSRRKRPQAYKDVDRVVDVIVRAGIARKVARLVPLGVLKG